MHNAQVVRDAYHVRRRRPRPARRDRPAPERTPSRPEPPETSELREILIVGGLLALVACGLRYWGIV